MIPEKRKMLWEKRKANRAELVVPATYSIHESSKEKIRLKEGVAKTTTRDISILGIVLDSKYPIPKKALLNIKIDGHPFYPHRKGFDNFVYAVGEVISTITRMKGHYRLKIRFVELQKEDEKAIAKFAEEHQRVAI